MVYFNYNYITDVTLIFDNITFMIGFDLFVVPGTNAQRSADYFYCYCHFYDYHYCCLTRKSMHSNSIIAPNESLPYSVNFYCNVSTTILLDRYGGILIEHLNFISLYNRMIWYNYASFVYVNTV